MQPFEVLLFADDERMAHALSAALLRAGHRVTVSTTLAGAVETLMRRGPYVDIILTRMTSARFGNSLGDDVVQYSRKFAANARLIVLRDAPDRVEDLELILARPAIPDLLRTSTSDAN